MLEGDAAMLTLAATFDVTVGVITLDVAGLPVAQAELDVKIQRTCWPAARVLVVYVLEFVPTLPHTPVNTCHWYVGDAPPLVGDAVYVTDVPAQKDDDPDIETLTG